jgi:predicted lipid-binding transport protein (Tim44 family)
VRVANSDSDSDAVLSSPPSICSSGNAARPSSWGLVVGLVGSLVGGDVGELVGGDIGGLVGGLVDLPSPSCCSSSRKTVVIAGVIIIRYEFSS